MNHLDMVVAQGVRSVLEEDLGPATYRKVEQEARDMYGTSVLEAVADFAKMDMVLRRFFGRHTTNLEAKVFGRVLAAAGGGSGEDASVSILEPTVASALFHAYGDPAKKAILDLVVSQPRSMSEIISAAGLPQASTYMRARRMVRDGLLRKAGRAEASDGRSVAAYRSTMTGILFESVGGGLRVDARIPWDVAHYSYAFNSVVMQ